MLINNKKDFASGFCLLAVGLFLAFLSMQLAVWSRSGPEAGFFPLTIAVLIIGCSLGVIGRSLVFRQAGREERISEAQESSGLGLLRVSAYAGLMLAYGFLIESLGFLLVSAILLILILKYLERQTWKITLLVGVPSIIISYFLFKYLLSVPLPAGKLIQ